MLTKNYDRMTPINRKPDLVSEVTMVTPDIAAAWLDKNTSNRKPYRAHIAALARDMQNGRWRLTGDAIRFSVTGRLLDGQHRLMACIACGIPFTTVVLYGLPDDAQTHIDLGKSRQASDFLSMEGIANAKNVQAAARLLLTWRSGNTSITGGANGRHTVNEVLDFIKRHQALPSSVRFSLHVAGLPLSIASAIHYVGFHLLDKADRADAMINVLRTGIPDYVGDPIHHLRERLLKSRLDVSRSLPERYKVAYAMHAWNHFAAKRSVDKLAMKDPSNASIHGLNLDDI